MMPDNEICKLVIAVKLTLLKLCMLHVTDYVTVTKPGPSNMA